MPNPKFSTPFGRIAAVILACWLFCPTANAGLLGKTLSIGLYTSSSLTTLVSGTALSTFTVTNSLEFDSWWVNPNGFFKVDVTDTTIFLYNQLEQQSTAPSSSRYVGFKDANGVIDDFSSTLTTLIHTVLNIDSSDLFVTTDSIGLRITNGIFPARTPDGYVSIQVGYASVTPPTSVSEPSSLILLLAPAITALVKRRKSFYRTLSQN